MRLAMLVIAGDRSVARLFTEIFTLPDWKVDTPYNGRDVVQLLLGSKHYDIILVSYRFPPQLA